MRVSGEKRIEQLDRDGVRILRLRAAPGIGLDADLLAGLAGALDDLDRRMTPVRALVLAGLDGPFPTGHPEYDPDLDQAPDDDDAPAPARLGDLCLRLENLDLPVLVALDGAVLGAGFELALAAHARVARLGATIGLTDLRLGLPPGAGGSQRLPRLVGAGVALDMLLQARVLDAKAGEALGLIDLCVPDDVEGAAVALALRIAGSGRWTRSGQADAGFADPAAYWQAVQSARTRAARAHPAAEAERRIVQCVEAAQMMPLAQGLALERSHHDDCAAHPASRALRHVARLDTLALGARDAAGPGRPCFTIGIIGATGLGPGLVSLALAAGFGVVLMDETRGLISSGLAEIEGTFARAVADGALSPEDRAARLRRLSTGIVLDDLAGVDVVLTAPKGASAEKLTNLFGRLGQILRPGAILMSTDPITPLADLAAASGRGADLAGLLVMPPVEAGDLFEIVSVPATAPDVIDTAYRLSARLNRVALRAAAVEGGIARRLLRACRDAADFMLEDGASPAEIDAALRAYGFALGPYQGLDREGLEVSAARRRARAPLRDPSLRYVEIGDRLCAMGRFGRRVGKGYYAYPDPDGPAQEDMAVIALIDELRAEKGLRARSFTEAEIQTRCVTAMMNAGAQLLVDRVAQSAADIDLAAIHALGFPRWEGGPMWRADQLGAAALRDWLEGFSAEAAHFWSPAALVLKLADEGGRFHGPQPGALPASAQEQPHDDDHQPEGGHEK